ncbi:hypothetical protein NRIC_35710 [Enterococcus florum]|uniref:Mannosyl-glycoprotein endo-beta-N-acetylglucosamidase-like domain-containing protein n=1 Tax=Enterococcus florum TaxID=2480627 RepID=A0A4P5PC75_9ENTE|nr:glucosaminidase domain-containing protein [Enterococcus florum]GCF95680.1 hypothetical protein NRIC_35710 [Enterococcus florum]
MKIRFLVGSLLLSGSLLGLLVHAEPIKTAQAADDLIHVTESSTSSSIEESSSDTSTTTTTSSTSSSSLPQSSSTTTATSEPTVTSSESAVEVPQEEPAKEEPATDPEPSDQQKKMEEHQGTIKPEKLENHYNFSVKKNQTTTSFIAEIGKDAQAIAWKNDLYGSVMIAQAILETGSGNSQLSLPPNHNLFGIKGSYKGKTVNFSTQEDNGTSQLYTIQAGFRRYPSYKESLADYAVLLKKGISGNSTFYQKTWKSQAATYKEATAFLTGRYATDTNYDKKLNALIETYELTKYDNDPAETKEETTTAEETKSKTAKQTAKSKEKEDKMVKAVETTQGGEVRSITTNGTKVMPPITQRPAVEIAGTRTGKEVAE